MATPQPQPPRIDIETEFATCVRKIGGEVLADRLGASPPFKNADYLFNTDNVVAELKCLQRDTRTEPTFKERVQAMHVRWHQEGKVHLPSGKVRVNSRTLPDECQAELSDLLTSRLKNVVQKANDQIKSTKEHLALPEAKGLLLLANDGDMIFQLDVVLHTLHRVLHGKYRQISSVVYFTGNDPVMCPGVPLPALIWMPLAISDRPNQVRPGVDEPFIEKLAAGWFNRQATIRGAPTLVARRGDDPPEIIERVRFIEGAHGAVP